MGTREFSRTRRVGEQIKRELAPMVQALAREHGYGMVSVTEAEVSPDLRAARVFVTQLANEQSPEQLLKSLDQAAGRFRHTLSKQLHLRNVPRLQFAFDGSLVRGAEISSLLRDLTPAAGTDEHSSAGERGDGAALDGGNGGSR